MDPVAHKVLRFDRFVLDLTRGTLRTGEQDIDLRPKALHLDLTTPIGRGFLAFLSALAEDERERIHKRASEGRRAAIARGVHMGRKPKLSEHQRRIALQRLRAGESGRAIARDMGVAHTTINRVAG
jgi:DNA invertase Pin-like site-specific DNA recombinase